MNAKFAALPFWALFQRGQTRAKQKLRPSNTVILELKDNRPVHAVDKNYLSFSIDISVLAGGYWWEGSGRAQRGIGALRVAPLDLHSRQLNLLARALAPALLRVGGSEADKIHYFDAPFIQDQALILRRSTWDDLHSFVRRNGFSLAFTINLETAVGREKDA